ncbi:MAG: hypothetical protein FE046_02075 [Thermoplasmata archaeon]|nr:MAG: hypothetical protein FE046_02075 [Thermoplasmata archaeon]
MNKSACAVALLLIASFIIVPEYNIRAEEVTVVYVDDDFNASTAGWQMDHFDSVQDAMDAVSAGGTVVVYAGVYYENVVINKTVTLVGEDRDTTIIDGGGSGDTVTVTEYADHLDMSGVTVRNCSTGWPYACLKIFSSSNTISECSFESQSGSVSVGIYFDGSSDSTIENCTFAYGWEGITFRDFSHNNTVSGCTFTDNTYGISLVESNDTAVSGCTFSDNPRGGILLGYSRNNSISNCQFTNDNWFGIGVSYAHDNGIENCQFYENDMGVYLEFSTGNSITRCVMTNNSYGVYLKDDSDNNTVYHNNFVNNTHQAYDECTNTWNDTYPSGGNYWSDFDEPSEGAWDNHSGPNQDEAGSDGIVDGGSLNPYYIPGGLNKDVYPLIAPLDIIPPYLQITVNGTEGNNGWYVSTVTLTVNATDNESSVDYVNYSINGVWYQSENASFTISVGQGVHTIVCYAVDIYGNAGAPMTVTVRVDLVPPSIEYYIDPPSPDGHNGWYVSTVYISLVADGTGSGVDELNYQIDEGGWHDYGGQFSPDVQGIHTLYFRAIDMAGNERVENVTLKMDSVAPQATIFQPDGGFVRQTHEITWNATDNADGNLNGSISLFYRHNVSGIWQEVEIVTGLNNTGSYMWNTYGFPDSKEATVKILVEDDAGNNGTATSAPFVLDNTPPTITITQPVPGKAYGKDEYGNIIIDVEWEAYDTIDDDLDGNISIQYYDGTTWTTLVENISNLGSYTFNAKEWDDGTYKVKIIAVDDAGNTGTATSGNFTIDKQPPSLFIATPLEGYVYINLFGRTLLSLPIPFATLSPYDVVIIGKITVEVQATDVHSGMQRVELSADTSFDPLYDTPYEWNWNPSFGVHSLTATAYDNAGNARTYEIEKILCLNI